MFFFEIFQKEWLKNQIDVKDAGVRLGLFYI
jgi:hypothetical protein